MVPCSDKEGGTVHIKVALTGMDIFPSSAVENGRTEILWDFKIQTDQQLMANQLRAVVIDAPIPSDIKKK